MNIETRLHNLYHYRDEALKDPVANKLYLEDLAISIEHFEKAVKEPKKEYEVINGMLPEEFD